MLLMGGTVVGWPDSRVVRMDPDLAVAWCIAVIAVGVVAARGATWLCRQVEAGLERCPLARGWRAGALLALVLLAPVGVWLLEVEYWEQLPGGGFLGLFSSLLAFVVAGQGAVAAWRAWKGD